MITVAAGWISKGGVARDVRMAWRVSHCGWRHRCSTFVVLPRYKDLLVSISTIILVETTIIMVEMEKGDGYLAAAKRQNTFERGH